jgi:type IV pilus assembly protein PilW
VIKPRIDIVTRQSTFNGQGGFSLVEMMISITIGLIVISALIGVLVSSSRNSRTNEGASELYANGRYALENLRATIRHADYRGYTWTAPQSTSIAIANECLAVGETAGSFIANLSTGIWGNDGNPYAANCLNSGYLRGDVLVIRKVAHQTLVSPAALADGEIYFRSSFVQGKLFQAAASSVATVGAPVVLTEGTPLADFLVQTYVYYIGSDDDNSAIPALRRLRLSGAAMVDEEVVAGIEHMQLEYSRATTDLNTAYYTATQIQAGTDSARDWQDVNAARVWLVARAAAPENGYTNTDTYTLGGVTYDPTDDAFRRQVFTSVIQIRNFHPDVAP